MRILITGASGLLGLNLALDASQEHTVFGVANHHTLQGTPFPVLQADLTVPGEIERLLDATQPDWVIHCAALANVDACETDPQSAHRINAEVPGLLAARCAGKHHVGKGGARAEPIRLVHISTDAVFDGLKGNYTEDDPPNPLSVYAQTKLAGERAVLQANPQAIVARVNLFGWSMGGRRSLAELFVNNLAAGKSMMGFTDVFFCPLLVNDIGPILFAMLEKGLDGLYHVFAGEAISKYDFGVAVAGQFGLDAGLIAPTHVADSGLKAARSPNLTMSTHKLSTALGRSLPALSPAIHRFWVLYQQGYPQRLQKLAGVGLENVMRDA
ncbi:MAG: SDR family oxidoreductase [Chloroflexota bacterium]